MTVREDTRTHEMTVDDMTFLVDRLHADCARAQFVRELTKNSIQAAEDLIAAEDGSQCAVTWNYQVKDGVKKLVLTDTGIGMTGPEMVDHINRLSASGRRQGNAFNYGVGAKISALPLNKIGMVYISKKHGEKDGALVHLWLDPNTRKYGIKQQYSAGQFSLWARVANAKLPAEIRDHGTQVLLLGNSESQDTTDAPDGVTGKKRWLFKYLYSRFFRVPKGVDLRVEVEREDGGREDPRRIRGLEHWLQQSSNSSGTVRLTGAVAHWFILKEGTDPASGHYPNLGIVAALWQDELYDMVTGATSNPRMIAFGVVFETKRVVLVLEPDSKKYPSLTSDTARARLLIDGGPLPWSEWAREFRESLPPQLEDLQQDAAARASAGDVRKNIVERLKLNLDLFKLSRYRRSPKGPYRVLSDSAEAATGESANDAGDSSFDGDVSEPGESRKKAVRASKFYSDLLDDSDASSVIAEQVEVTDKVPEVQFISIENETRQSGDLEDRAARFVSADNLLLVNEDFRVFVDMRSRWERNYRGNETAKLYIRERVREWFSQQLIEAVMTGRVLAGSAHWTDTEVEDKLWSSEALTAAILPRYHIDKAIKRELGSKFGRVGEVADVD